MVKQSKVKTKSKSKSKSKLTKSKHITKKIINEVIEDPIKFAKNSKINEIVRFLKHCSEIYSNTSKEVVSDDVYDYIKDILEERDPKNSFLSQIGAQVKDKVDLPYPMASQDKVKPGSSKLVSWFTKFKGPYVISDKLDGISAQLIKYKNGDIKLYTRGDGTKGKDISHLVKRLVSNQSVSNLPKGTSLRGEIIISRKNYPLLNNQYANGRAAMSGFTGADDGDYNETSAKYAELVIYGMIYPTVDDHVTRMKKIKKYGFTTVWQKILNNMDDDNFNFENELKSILLDRRLNSEYEIDGIVCIDSSKGYVDTSTNPKHSFAFKMRFADQTAITTVIDVEWDPTMYAYIQPTVVIKSVKIGGSTIERATGHNAKYINDNNIGKGSIIEIIKSGDVIPYILNVKKQAENPIMPSIKYKWHENGYEIIATEIKGETAIAIGIKRTHHFFKTLKIKYISEGIITKLYHCGYNNIFKILSANHEDLYEIDGIGKKLVTKIYTEIDKKITSCKLPTLMGASLQFDRGFGVRRSRAIVDAYPDIMYQKIKKVDMFDNINDIEGFSEITANQFVDNLQDFKIFFERLSKYVDISHLTQQKKNKKSKNIIKVLKHDFSGEKVVFTGFRNEDLEELISGNGGSISGSVSGNTTMLVYVYDGDIDKKPAKLNKAEELFENTGKPLIITKENFIKTYC